jgi:hypothetical protein
MLHNSSIGIVMKFAPDAQRSDHIAIRSHWARRGFVDCCGDLPVEPLAIIAGNRDARPALSKVHILRRKRVARRDYFLERNQRDLGCPVPSEKIFWFSETEISARFAAILSHQRGVGQRH